MNSLVPKTAIIDFKPLCPPALPRARKRIVPKGRARSSLITTSDLPTSASSSFASRQANASPLTFMNVCGFTSFDLWPSITPPPTSERHSRRFTVTPSSAANLSTSRKPTLCRVHSYSLPGLPSPAIKYIAECQLKIARLRSTNLLLAESGSRRPVDAQTNRQLAIANRQCLTSSLLPRLLRLPSYPCRLLLVQRPLRLRPALPLLPALP